MHEITSLSFTKGLYLVGAFKAFYGVLQYIMKNKHFICIGIMNEVTRGNTYELMYWDKTWVSAGVKEAIDTFLVYKNIPTGTLYWLKNHTKGRQEQVFLLDENGQQYWPGVTSVNHMYRDFLKLERLCD